MQGVATFHTRGLIGHVREFDDVTKVKVYANYDYKNDNGDWVDNPHANTVTFFKGKTRDWVNANLGEGDHVEVFGRMRDDSYMKNGEKEFATTFIAEKVTLIARKDRSSE